MNTEPQTTMKNMTLAQAYKKQFGKVSYPFEIFDANGKLTYYETSKGYWSKSEYDANGKRTYFETSDGYWSKREYDANGTETYFETSNGYWSKREYDANGTETYFEDSNGYWSKREYDANGTETYFEDSNGRILGQKQTIEIDGVEYSAEQVRERIAELKPIKDK